MGDGSGDSSGEDDGNRAYLNHGVAPTTGWIVPVNTVAIKLGARALIWPVLSIMLVMPLLVALNIGRSVSIARMASISCCWLAASECPNQLSSVKVTI